MPSWSVCNRSENLDVEKETGTDLMANTKSITDTEERKKIKRAARKKAAPKAPRTGARGENKQKLKKASKGKNKR